MPHSSAASHPHGFLELAHAGQRFPVRVRGARADAGRIEIQKKRVETQQRAHARAQMAAATQRHIWRHRDKTRKISFLFHARLQSGLMMVRRAKARLR